jgi:hypothetical protein
VKESGHRVGVTGIGVSSPAVAAMPRVALVARCETNIVYRAQTSFVLERALSRGVRVAAFVRQGQPTTAALGADWWLLRTNRSHLVVRVDVATCGDRGSGRSGPNALRMRRFSVALFAW